MGAGGVPADHAGVPGDVPERDRVRGPGDLLAPVPMPDQDGGDKQQFRHAEGPHRQLQGLRE